MKGKISDYIALFYSLTSMVFGVLFYAVDFGLQLWLQLIVSLAFLILANLVLIFYFKNVHLFYKLSITIWFIMAIVAIVFIIFYFCGWIKFFEDPDVIKQIILDSGIWGILVFFVLQFLQVMVAFIPSMVTTLVGVAIFGPLVASLVSVAGILLGSFVAFFIGRYLGRKVVVWIAGEEQTEKYCELLNKKGKFLLILMFLFPVFPDDMLCFIAGVTTMSFRFYFFTVIFTRPISIFVTAFLGSGQLIPYSGWGLVVWPILIALLVIVFILSWKYQEKIENYIISKFDKIKNNFKKKK